MLNEKHRGAISPTLFIGLGGTGKEILLRLRRKFYEQFGTPNLPCVGFLWLDTDTRTVGARGEKLDEIYQSVYFKEDERILLLDGTVRTNLGNILGNPDEYQHIHKWLYKEVREYGNEIKDGAQNVRAIGRLAFFSQYEEIRNRLENMFNQICSHFAIYNTQKIKRLRYADFFPTLRVFIVTSVVGGTGAGTYLDVAFLIRDLKQEMIFENIEQIISVVLLPNIYYVSPSDEVSKRSYGNAYAALKELEYYTLRRRRTGIGEGEDASLDFEVEWEKGEVKCIKGPPLNITYLIENRSEAGITLTPDDRGELFQVIAESLFLDFLPGEFSTNKRSDYPGVAAHLASEHVAFAGIESPEFSQFFAQRYASFGFSKIQITEDALLLACSAQLAHDILIYLHRISSEKTEYVNDAETKFRLNKFREKLVILAGYFSNRKRGFLSFGKDALSVRFFDEKKDWDKFYVLGIDEEGNFLPVNPEKKAKEFIIKNFEGNEDLWRVIDLYEKEDESTFVQKLTEFCEERFRDDFLINPREITEVIKHPHMKERWSENVNKLVNAALPLARISKVERKMAYLGINTRMGDEYEELIRAVRERLIPFGYNVEPYETGKPSEVSLYTVCYAFPLAHLPLISEQCHSAYYEFCRDLRRGQITDRKHKIPLHIDKRWEGKFGDLRIYDAQERIQIKEASEVLLLGPVLRVVDIQEGDDGYNFTILREAFVKIERNPLLGHYYEAIEYLKENSSLRNTLKEELKKREGQLNDKQWRIFYWALCYFYHNNDLYPQGSVEKSILERMYEEVKAQWGEEKRESWDVHSDKEGLEKARSNLGEDVQWVGDFPIMQDLKPWVKK